MDELARGQYFVVLVKIVRQRPEHVATALKRHPRTYGWKFVTIEKFDAVPEHFREVFHAIMTKGICVDGTAYGGYALTPHGRGKKYGVFKPEETRYRAGCKITLDQRGITIREVKFHSAQFLKLLETHWEVNQYIASGRLI
jgi:hypothetical protein